MESNGPFSESSEESRLALITDTQQRTWFGDGAPQPIALKPKHFAWFGLAAVGIAVLITGLSWLRNGYGNVIALLATAVFLTVFLTVVAPWIDRTQRGVQSPVVPPKSLRKQVWGQQMKMFLPMNIVFLFWIPASMFFEQKQNYAAIFLVTLFAMAVAFAATIWGLRRLASKSAFDTP